MSTHENGGKDRPMAHSKPKILRPMPNNIEKAVDVLGKAIDDLIEERDEMYEKMEQLRAENEKLKKWKAEQLIVEASWDEQEVGRLLGLTVGSMIRQNIARGIHGLRTERDRLREILRDSLRSFSLTQNCEHYGEGHWSNRARASLQESSDNE